MTNREAIAILNEAYLKMLDHQFIILQGYEIEALEMAIQSLEREATAQRKYSNVKSFW